MKFSFWLLYDFLEPFSPEMAAYHSSEYSEIVGVRLFQMKEEIKSDYVYILSAEEMFDMERERVGLFNVILVSSTQMGIDTFEAYGNLLILCTDNSALEVLAYLMEKMEEYHLWYQDMLKALLSKNGIKKALNLASEKLYNPIALFDSAANLVEWKGELSGDWRGTIWESVIRLGYAPSDYYSLKEYREMTDKLVCLNRPILMHVQKDPKHMTLASGIVVDGELAGSFGLVDVNRPFTQGQVYLVGIITELFKIAYLGSKELQEITKNALFYFHNLILGKEIDKKQLSSYLMHAGWGSDGVYVLVLISLMDKTVGEQQYFLDKLKGRFDRCVSFAMRDEAVLILPQKSFPWDEKGFREDIETLFEKSNMLGIISSSFREIQYLKTYYDQCHRGLQCVQAIEKNGLLLYGDMFKQDLLNAISANGDMNRYCHPLLAQLWEEEYKKSWIRGLYYFLLSGKNAAQAANVMHIHRNTLIYHIKKIEEDLGINLNDLNESQSLYFLISCMILMQE